MSRIIVCTNLSLDGVMQAPARADEDTRGAFSHGGWAAPYAAMSEAGEVFGNTGALLLGRRTYEDFHSVWPQRRENSISSWLDNIPKYVASRTLAAPLEWSNSTLLQGDAADSLPALKREQERDFLILGSGDLVRSLMQRDLIDRFVLCIHPLLLGGGRRLFPEADQLAQLALVQSRTTSSGVVISTYEPARDNQDP